MPTRRPKTRRYEAHARLATQQAMDGRAPLAGPAEVSMKAHLPIPNSWSKKRQRMAECGQIDHIKRPDLDNLGKSILDALGGIVFRNDAQVVWKCVTRAYGRLPRIDACVRPRPTEVP